jgi:hypothetical protein
MISDNVLYKLKFKFFPFSIEISILFVSIHVYNDDFSMKELIIGFNYGGIFNTFSDKIVSHK